MAGGEAHPVLIPEGQSRRSAQPTGPQHGVPLGASLTSARTGERTAFREVRAGVRRWRTSDRTHPGCLYREVGSSRRTMPPLRAA